MVSFKFVSIVTLTLLLMAFQVAAMSIGIQYYNSCKQWKDGVNKETFSTNKSYLINMLIGALLAAMLVIGGAYMMVEQGHSVAFSQKMI